MFPGRLPDEDNPGSPDSDSSDEDIHFWPIRRASLPKKIPKPSQSQVEALQNTDFFNETSEGLGQNLEECHRFKVQHNLLNLLQNREVNAAGDYLQSEHVFDVL